jgi:hypothetical protein
MEIFKKDVILRWIGDNVFNIDKKEFMELCKCSIIKKIDSTQIKIGDVIEDEGPNICVEVRKGMQDASLYCIKSHKTYNRVYYYDLLTNPAIYEHRYYKRIIKKLKLEILKEKLDI